MTPREIKTTFSNIDFTIIPNWNSYNEIVNAFELIRDKKYLICSNIFGNKRKIPWFYVENGCFLRAYLAKNLLNENNYPKIKKVFVFGEFEFESEWSEKNVTFKDHVALGVRLDKTIYILDPSIEYSKPLLLGDWIDKLTSKSKNKNIKISICNELTFSHNSNYNESKFENEVGYREIINTEGIKIQYPLTGEYFAMEYLNKEYLNLVRLGKISLILNKN